MPAHCPPGRYALSPRTGRRSGSTTAPARREHQIGGPAGEIYGGGYGLVATNPSTGDLWRYLGTPQEWELIGSPGATFVVTGNTVVGLSPDRSAVWQYDGTGTS